MYKLVSHFFLCFIFFFSLSLSLLQNFHPVSVSFINYAFGDSCIVVNLSTEALPDCPSTSDESE